MPIKPSEQEEAYIAKLEIERKKKLEEERLKKLAEEEKQKLKELHYMRCPKCGMNLTEIEYQNIKVDKCFSCDGVWLDAGEIEAVTKLKKSTMDTLFNLFKK